MVDTPKKGKGSGNSGFTDKYVKTINEKIQDIQQKKGEALGRGESGEFSGRPQTPWDKRTAVERLAALAAEDTKGKVAKETIRSALGEKAAEGIEGILDKSGDEGIGRRMTLIQRDEKKHEFKSVKLPRKMINGVNSLYNKYVEQPLIKKLVDARTSGESSAIVYTDSNDNITYRLYNLQLVDKRTGSKILGLGAKRHSKNEEVLLFLKGDCRDGMSDGEILTDAVNRYDEIKKNRLGVRDVLSRVREQAKDSAGKLLHRRIGRDDGKRR